MQGAEREVASCYLRLFILLKAVPLSPQARSQADNHLGGIFRIIIQKERGEGTNVDLSIEAHLLV